MAKGRFESGASVSRKAPVSKTTRKRVHKKKRSKALPIVLAVLGAVVVLGGGVLLLNELGVLNLFSNATEEGLKYGHIAEHVYAAGVDLSNMTEKEAVEALEAAAEQYSADMKITLTQTPTEGQELRNEPMELVFPANQTGVTLNPQKAFEEAYRVGREVGRSAEGADYVVPAERCFSMDTTLIQTLVDEASAELYSNREVQQVKYSTRTEKRDVTVEDEEGNTKTERQDVTILQVRKGIPAADFRRDDLYNAVMQAYAEAQFDTQFDYTVLEPDPLDMDALFQKYCTEPKDASYDTRTHEIVDEVTGYGFDREELQKLLSEAEYGETVEVALAELKPEITRASLEDSMFSDVLASTSTPCTANWNRTRNLELACQAIDGTVLQPGEVFSFNNVVGIRTEAKGYKPATAYVTGGASAEEIGGGVCQVASSIYYAALLADLKIVERTEHMYAVTYVPMGMDATVYYGSLDFKFENSTDYPLRIDANVSGGYVNISLNGTDTHDYTVNMTYDVLATIPWEEVEVETDEAEPGSVVTTAYTGYVIQTYMHKVSKATGEEISVEKVARSNYQKRDREIAVPIGGAEPTEYEPPFPISSSEEETQPYDPGFIPDPYTPPDWSGGGD